MDIEATQALDFAEYDDETDDEGSGVNMKPVAQLKVLAHRDIRETVYDIFEGTTVIGRDPDSCGICLTTFKSLSKQHASIEVTDETHLIYDLESRNKTRREKLFLRPNIRYELKHGDNLTFGDVRCVYLRVQPLVRTSDICSSSFTPVAQPVAPPSPLKAAMFFDNSDSDSDASSDILQQTQFDDSLLLGVEKSKTDNLNVISSHPDKDQAKAGKLVRDENVAAAETPTSQMIRGGLLRKTADCSMTNYVPDSDCETDSDATAGSPECSVVEDTQAFDTNPVTKSFKTVSNQAKNSSETVGTQVFEANNSSETAGTQMFEANHSNETTGTQVFGQANSDDVVSAIDSQTAPTQVCEMSDFPTQTYDETTYKLMSRKKSSDSEDIATLCYDLGVGILSSRRTNDPKNSQNSHIATQEDSNISCGKKSDQRDNLPSSLTSSLGATQVFDIGQGCSKSESQSDLVATQVFDFPSRSQASGPNLPPSDPDVSETQVLTSNGRSEGLAEDGGTESNEKRLTFSPQTSSTQALSETDSSFPHLELDLSEYNNNGVGRRSSATHPEQSESSSKVAELTRSNLESLSASRIIANDMLLKSKDDLADNSNSLHELTVENQASNSADSKKIPSAVSAVGVADCLPESDEPGAKSEQLERHDTRNNDVEEIETQLLDEPAEPESPQSRSTKNKPSTVGGKIKLSRGGGRLAAKSSTGVKEPTKLAVHVEEENEIVQSTSTSSLSVLDHVVNPQNLPEDIHLGSSENRTSRGRKSLKSQVGLMELSTRKVPEANVEQEKITRPRGQKGLKSGAQLVRLSELPEQNDQNGDERTVKQNNDVSINKSNPVFDVYSMDHDEYLKDLPEKSSAAISKGKRARVGVRKEDSNKTTQLVKLKDFTAQTIQVENDDGVDEIKNREPVFDVYSMDLDANPQDLPTQEFDSFVPPIPPNQRSGDSAGVTSSKGKGHLRGAKGKKNVVDTSTLVRIDELQKPNTDMKESDATAHPCPEEACVLDVLTVRLDADLDNIQTQAFSEVEHRDGPTVLLIKAATVRESLSRSRKTGKQSTNTDQLETQIFETEESAHKTKSSTRSSRNSAARASKAAESNSDNRVSLIRLQDVPSACSSSIPVDSDASRLLDVLATQQFCVQTLESENLLDGSEDLGEIREMDALETQAFDYSPKVDSTKQIKRGFKLKNSNGTGSKCNRMIVESQDERLLLGDERASTVSDVSHCAAIVSKESVSARDSRRQSTRPNKGKHRGPDNDDKLNVPSKKLSGSKKKESLPSDDEEGNNSTFKGANDSLAINIEEEIPDKVSKSRIGSRKRKLLPNENVLLDEAANDDVDEQIGGGENKLPCVDRKRSSRPVLDNVTFKPVQTTGRGKKSHTKVRAGGEHERNIALESFVGKRGRGKDIETVPNSQMSDEELPPLSVFTALCPNKQLTLPSSESSLPDNTVDSEVVAKPRNRASKEHKLANNEESQELPIACRDPEGLQQKLSLLANKIQNIDKSKEGIAKKSTSRTSLSTKRVISPSAETAQTPSADNEYLDTNKTVSPKKSQRGSRQKSKVTHEDTVKEDTNSVETTSSTDISLAEIKLGAAKGPRSKISKTAARQSTIACISDSAVTDSSCDESNSKRSRRQTNCVNEKVSKSGALENDDVLSVPTNSANTEKPASGSRQRGKAAGKSVTPTVHAAVTEKSLPMVSPRRAGFAKPKVMFTGVVDQNGEKIVKNLGGDIAESIHECTHLVTDQVRRTVKFLCGLARGISIVTPAWLAKCKETGAFINAEDFLVLDVANEKKFQFSLSSSLKVAAAQPLLSGYKVHVTGEVKPEPNQMKDIVQSAGGKYVVALPRKFEDHLVVVSCDDDAGLCKPVIDCGIPVVTSEFLLTGILRQKIDLESHRLLSVSASVAPSRGDKRTALDKTPVQAKMKRK